MRQRDIVILYMNLHPVKNGFPQRDEVPAQILTENLDISSVHYRARCCAFFTAIFTVLKNYLRLFLKQHRDDATTAIRAWNDYMCDMDPSNGHRAAFFNVVKTEYDKVCLHS